MIESGVFNGMTRDVAWTYYHGKHKLIAALFVGLEESL